MIKYFLYSQTQFDEKNEILEKSNKEFVPGIVVDQGIKKSFTAISTQPTLPRYFDTEVVASGEESLMTYIKPTIVKRTRG